MNKNIHILPTNKPSKKGDIVVWNGLKIWDGIGKPPHHNQNIYITSDKEIKKGDWFLLDMSHSSHPNEVHQMGHNKWSKTGGINFSEPNSWTKACKKIILTTDPDLIKDGVHAIDDEFLEWFVKNPSCERVEVTYDKDAFPYGVETSKEYGWYKVIIPQEEPKQIKCYCGHTITCDCEPLQETLKEFINQSNTPEGLDQFSYDKGLEDGAKWQQERMYSEEEVRELFNHYKEEFSIYRNLQILNVQFEEWFEQYKKK